MRRGSISDSEKARRALLRAEALASVETLLFTRRQTSKALGGISVATIQRLEKRGLLHVVKLAGSNGVAFHRASQVRALAERGVETVKAAKTAPDRRDAGTSSSHAEPAE